MRDICRERGDFGLAAHPDFYVQESIQGLISIRPLPRPHDRRNSLSRQPPRSSTQERDVHAGSLPSFA